MTALCLWWKQKNFLILMNSKKLNFVKVPEIDGGNSWFRKFIEENLKYPEAAINAGTQGTVLLSYDVDDNGKVENPRILKGIGNGCDEEALRLIRMLKFSKVRNKGMRLKMTKKARIHFKLPTQEKVSISYTLKPSDNTSNPQESTGKITWTINL